MTGKRLRAIREAYGLSASELSDMLGIERTYWSRWEHGRRPVPLDVAWKLTQMFEVDLDYILAGDVRSVPPAVQAKLRSPR
ncbi:MAG: helix-turn-helix transcriptional regulator [Pseudomonadota bacterium]